MGLFDFLFKQKKTPPEQIIPAAPVPKHNLADKLEQAGYFKYTSPSDIPELKNAISEGVKDKFLATVYNDDKPYNAKDHRFYVLDGETLFEEEGFTDSFKDFQHIFNLIGLTFEVTNHIEEGDLQNHWVNHSMTVNGKNYVIFKNFTGYGWGEAAREFSKILNEQLILQGKEERIFLYNGGNDGQAVLLTEKQFEIIDSSISDPHGKPLRLEDWCKLYQVAPM